MFFSRTVVAMCFSPFQFPRCRIHTLTNSWWESIGNCTKGGNHFRLIGSSDYWIEGKYTRRWTREPVHTSAEGWSQNSLTSKKTAIRSENSDETIATSVKFNLNKPEVTELEKNRYCDIQQMITENKDLAKLITVIVFDIETTGFSRQNERIIEIALQDLGGGENSTFHTLINPERYVSNLNVHGISTNMVNRSDVPRMADLIPILLEYVISRQKPGGYILWIAHNARIFDVPFLIEEFSRCSFEVPSEWLFLDTLPLARELMKSGGSKLRSRISLQALRKHYGIPLDGSAHRAMSDVNSLSLILQRMTFDLKMPISSLVERSFRASDLVKPKKNKS